MVDALRRARRWVTPDGSIIDLHPTAVDAWLEIDEQRIGPLDGGDAPERHGRATAAIEAALAEGLFVAASAVDFLFFTYGDSIDELRDHIAAHWRSTRIGEALYESARARRRADPRAGRPRVVEQVRLTVLKGVDASRAGSG
jgi:hypothetical protein